MKKTFLLLTLLISTAFALHSQTDRISVHLGGGASTNFSNYDLKNLYFPMGSLDVGFTYISPDRGDARFGFRTAISLALSEIGFRTDVDRRFTNYDYEKRQVDYSIRARVDYYRKQFTVSAPFLFVVMKGGFSLNLGGKFFLPFWNRYTQQVSNPVISAYYPEFGVTVTNDIATGLLSEEQKYITGKANLPYIALGVTAEIGYLWDLSYGNKLGFDFFVDYSPWGFGGASSKEVKNPIEVDPIVNDAYQPHAPVTVNLLSECGGDKWNYINFGLRIVYAFDFE